MLNRRQEQLIKLLTEKKDWMTSRELNLTDLQSQIYVSDSSIQNDLKRIRRMIEPYPGLRLVRSRE